MFEIAPMSLMQTSGRVLNERSGFFGLSVLDFGVLAYALIGANTVFSRWGLEILAFPVAGLLGVVLVTIRLRFRRKTIRDFAKHLIFLGRIG